MYSFRFIKEYANYIKRRFNETDIPGKQKKMYINDIDKIVNMASAGYIIVNECMQKLADVEFWLNSYKRNNF